MGEGSPWSSSWWAVAINDCAGHQINITKPGRSLCFNVYNLLCTPPQKGQGAIDDGNHSVVLRSRGKVPKMRIDTLNIGGVAHKAVDVDLTRNGYLDLGLVNFEPKGMGDTLKDEVIRVAGTGSFHLDHLIYHDPFRRLFNFAGTTASNIIRSHHAAGDGGYENVIEVT